MKADGLSLRQRLLLWLLLPIVALAALWVWSAYGIVLHFGGIAYDRALEDTVRTIAGQVRFEGGTVSANLPPVARRMLEYDQVDRVYFSVSDDLGRLIVGNRLLPAATGSDARDQVRFANAEIDHAAVRLAELTLVDEADPSHSATVRVAETVRKRTILAREVLLYMAVPQLAFVVGIAALVWAGVGYGIRPLRAVRDAIARRTPEDLQPLDDIGLPIEAREQVRVINGLMQRLGRTLDAQRRFIADATHQLRTPIAVIKAQAELARSTEDPVELRALAGEIDGTAKRLVRLANQLLNLSRAEAGAGRTLDMADFELAAVVEEAAADLVPSALRRHLEVRVDTPPDAVSIHGDRHLCREMLANLIDNAIRYTPAGGQVDVALRVDGPRVRVEVADTGPGIPAEQRDRVLERFYRLPESPSEGSGLGLPIAREIAAFHGGRLLLRDRPGAEGLLAIVELPRASIRPG